MDLDIETLDQKDIPTHLLKISKRFYEIQKRLKALSRKSRPAHRERSKIADEIFLEVCEETDERGKLKFSNARTREIESRRRWELDSRYKSALAAIEENSDEAEDLRLESNHLVDLKEILYLKAGVQAYMDPPPDENSSWN